MATYTQGAITDDVYRYLTPNQPGGWDFTLNTVTVGAFSETNYQFGTGLRFVNVTIPQGATIDQAYLTLQASASNSGLGVNTRISAEDVDDAPTFADDAAAFDTRWAARTTARVDWDAIPAWTNDTQYNSPEIKTVIQEIVDRAGWVSGNDIVIFWDDFEDRSTHGADRTRSADAYSGGFHPELVITYSTTPIVTISAASSITPTTVTLNGNVTATGGENPTVTVYWGTSDGGQTPGSWGNSSAPTSPAQPQGVAAFTKNVTGLVSNTLYYFSAKATNAAGTDWPPASLSFTTASSARFHFQIIG